MGFVADLRTAILGNRPAYSTAGEQGGSADAGRRRGRLHVLTPRGKAVFAITPKELDDAYDAALSLVQGAAVFVNLQEIDRALGQRIADVVSGVAFGIGGRIMPSGDRLFIFVPADYALTPEEKAQLAEEELFPAGFLGAPAKEPSRYADEPPPEMRKGLFGKPNLGAQSRMSPGLNPGVGSGTTTQPGMNPLRTGAAGLAAEG